MAAQPHRLPCGSAGDCHLGHGRVVRNRAERSLPSSTTVSHVGRLADVSGEPTGLPERR